MSVLLIDPFSSGAHYLDLLKDAGTSFSVVRTQRALDSGLSEQGSLLDAVVDNGSLEDLPELLKYCEQNKIDTIITGAESGVPLAESLKVQLGLASDKHNDDGQRFWNKSDLYRVVSEASLRAPKSVIIVNTDLHPGQWVDLLSDVGPFPAVVKPNIGAGSVGVRIVHDEEQARAAIQAIAETSGFFGEEHPGILLQEYVEGREYVIDTFSKDGQHEVLAICTYDKHASSAGSMVYDRLRWLDLEASGVDQLVLYTIQVLDALDHRNGSVHTEVIVDAAGPCLVDLGARPHGAGHPLKTYRLTGNSQLHAEVSATSERSACPVPPYALNGFAAIEFLSLPAESRILDDANPLDLLNEEFVLSGEIQALAGAIYPETHSLIDSENLGIVFVSGLNEDDVSRNAVTLRQAFANMIQVVDRVG
jgi:hypothetical protein